MNVKLLIDWADALDHLDTMDWMNRGFSMTYWAKNKTPETPELGCGTVCCAYGVGTALRSWREAGLGLQKIYFLGEKYSYAPTDGAASILGLSAEEWVEITSPHTYEMHDRVTPGIVAARIREILKRENRG